MPIVIQHGGGGSLSQFLPGLIAGKRIAQDEERFQLTKQRVEQEMELQEQEEKRRKEEERRRNEAEARANQARQQTPGMIGDMTRAPQGPQDPNASETQKFEASIRANTERMGKIAAKIAETDPEKGLEYAQRFLEEGQKDLHRMTADRGISEMMREIGEGMTTPGTYGPMPFGDQAVEDPTYQETMKGVLQELQAAQGPEVTPEQKIEALQNANKTRQQVRKDLTRRNEQNASTAAARDTINQRVGEGAGRLTTAQKGKLGALTANIGFEEGMVNPSEVDKRVDEIMRGTVQVPNPFSFGGGGDMLEMTPESAAKLQESLSKIQESQTRQGSNLALESQRNAKAKEADASAALKNRTDPNARSAPKNGTAGGTPEERLAEEVKSGKITSPEQLEKRAAELGAKLK